MADEAMTELALPSIPQGLDPELDLYMRQLDTVLTDLASRDSYSSGLVSLARRGYVDRGDPGSYDWDEGDLTTDDTWNDLDLSSIVPENAILVALSGNLADDAVNSYLQFRKNGNTNTVVKASQRTQVANVVIDFDLIVACDSDRVIEYLGANLTFSSINLVVKGWWIGE
jgi:hypothetical protein